MFVDSLATCGRDLCTHGKEIKLITAALNEPEFIQDVRVHAGLTFFTPRRISTGVNNFAALLESRNRSYLQFLGDTYSLDVIV